MKQGTGEQMTEMDGIHRSREEARGALQEALGRSSG